jgi:hypothetical protein
MMSIKPQLTEAIELKKFVFDPLSTIVKLAILGNKPTGSKISIKDNIIYIQESGFIQTLSRYYWGDTKSDLHYLSIPVEIACKRYLSTDVLKRIPNIITLFQTSEQGLIELMKTYKQYPIIIHCLKYYYSIIETHINELNFILKQNNLTHLNTSPNISTNTFNTSNISKPITIGKNMSPLILPLAGSAGSVGSPGLYCSSWSSGLMGSAGLNQNVSNSPQQVFYTPNTIIAEAEAGQVPVQVPVPETTVSSTKSKSKKKNHLNDISSETDTKLETIKIKEESDLTVQKEESDLTLQTEESDPTVQTEESNKTVQTVVDLTELYDETLLLKFENVWTDSKINIVIGMIEYLLIENSPTDYAGCIETFMQPIDKEIVRIISDVMK